MWQFAETIYIGTCSIESSVHVILAAWIQFNVSSLARWTDTLEVKQSCFRALAGLMNAEIGFISIRLGESASGRV